MFSPRPPDRVPQGVPPAAGAYLRRTGAQLEALSRFQGVAVSGGTLPTEVIPQAQWIFGQIRNEESDSSLTSSESSSSDSSSNKFSLSPPGAGFTDEEGFLAFAFDQIYDDYPWKGIIIPNGIRTTIPTKTQSGANHAYPLNSEFFSAGTNVILKRAGNHWVIIGVVGSDSSSDAQEFSFLVDCEGGTIVVGDKDQQIPVDQPADNNPEQPEEPEDDPTKKKASGSITTDTGDPGIP